MILKLLPKSPIKAVHSKFNAAHPMFTYEVEKVPSSIAEKFRGVKNFVVIGIGGSVIPLKVFVDYFQLGDRIHFVDTVDSVVWERCKNLENSLFCVVSKSGETLEIKALLAELVHHRKLNQTMIVTDESKGFLREFARRQNLPTLTIPSNIGGRFTNFTVFHRALLERFEISFDELLQQARKVRDHLVEDPSQLQHLHSQLFESHKSNLILWAYGQKFVGLAAWVQQVIAESLGKKNKQGQRVGIFPIVLQGPQDQHSVLQLLSDGPQNNCFWFFMLQKNLAAKMERSFEDGLKEFNRIGLPQSLDILAESTARTFEERLTHTDTAQPLARWEFEQLSTDLAAAIASIQALIEYCGDKLGVDPFDQPGVERGKQIARELVQTFR